MPTGSKSQVPKPYILFFAHPLSFEYCESEGQYERHQLADCLLRAQYVVEQVRQRFDAEVLEVPENEHGHHVWYYSSRYRGHYEPFLVLIPPTMPQRLQLVTMRYQMGGSRDTDLTGPWLCSSDRVVQNWRAGAYGASNCPDMQVLAERTETELARLAEGRKHHAERLLSGQTIM